MHKLIICADDYGLTESVNRAVWACLKAGTVQSTCVMPNMDFAYQSKNIAIEIPQASIGIHWNLTFGRPLSPLHDVPSLVDIGGNFHNFIEFRKRLTRSKINVDEVRIEFKNQLDRLQDFIGQVDFWNTHQNVHLWPGLFQLCSKIAINSGIRKMRSNSRVTLSPNTFKYNLQHPIYALKGIILDYWSRKCLRQGSFMPDGLVALPGAGAGKMRLEEYLHEFSFPKEKKIVEASIHPADESENLLFGKLTNSRYQEYKFFSDASLKDRLLELGYQCVSFKSLEYR